MLAGALRAPTPAIVPGQPGLVSLGVEDEGAVLATGSVADAEVAGSMAFASSVAPGSPSAAGVAAGARGTMPPGAGLVSPVGTTGSSGVVEAPVLSGSEEGDGSAEDEGDGSDAGDSTTGSAVVLDSGACSDGDAWSTDGSEPAALSSSTRSGVGDSSAGAAVLPSVPSSSLRVRSEDVRLDVLALPSTVAPSVFTTAWIQRCIVASERGTTTPAPERSP